ncbi:hypothetical protein R5W24_001407 [Gemmata sp. JC717]|uniref:hypothetical protein n=1 Tax=Gemmata algarum TaxID=2975278 RepID=UPI0021BA3C7D|nr:hypothetical protein [Gemmata algarum]MDY3552326.1 hypothetical protein [Gemmata algarum]
MEHETTAEPPPGCLVLLLRLSSGMTRDVVTPRGEAPAVEAARLLTDDLIEGLVNTAAAGYAVGALDVAVLGYRAPDQEGQQLLSLLPDGDPKPRFVPLAHVAGMPAVPRDGEGLPRKWAVLPPCAGEPSAGAALASVYQMVSVWLTGRYASRPPVVIHCAGGGDHDDRYFSTARSLNLLTTAHGPTRLLHYTFAPPPADAVDARLASVSAALTTRPGAFINEWDIADPWDAIFTCAFQEDATVWAEAGEELSRVCAMWAQKMGNTPEQWEDAYALDEGHGAAAIADGASSGIYCNIWAQQLSRRLLADRPDVRDPASLNKWVSGLRAEWRAAINYDGLNWSKQAKVDQVGAAATLLGLEVGPAGVTGGRPWRACAVGDASLFWVRQGELLATFPVVAADQFGSAPLLVRSSPGYRTVALSAAGTCEPGDRFVLATDAVAARLFKSVATEPGVDWARLEDLAEADWRAELDALRRGNDMVNDDCTLIVLRVTDPASGVRESPRTVEEALAGEPLEPAFAVEEVPANEVLTLEEAIALEPLAVEPAPANEPESADPQEAGVPHSPQERSGAGASHAPPSEPVAPGDEVVIDLRYNPPPEAPSADGSSERRASSD